MATWRTAELAITRSRVQILPVAAVYQCHPSKVS